MHVLSRLDRGGAETVALDLVQALDAKELEQHFVCIGGGEGLLAPRFRKHGAIVHEIPLKPLPNFIWRLYQLLKAVAPDVMVSHVSLASVLPLGIARLAGVPVRSARFHSAGDGRAEGTKRRTYRAVTRRVFHLVATDATGVTQAALDFGVGTRRRARGKPDFNATIVPNGVDTSIFTPPVQLPSRETLRVLHVGRPAPEKNRRALVPMAHALAKLGNIELRSVGSASTDDLRGTIPSNLYLVDMSDCIPAEMQQAHTLVLPSLREGLPGVVLEALSSGLPVVASDLPTLRELSLHLPGITLVDPHASSDEWATACYRAALAGAQERTRLRAAVLESEYTLQRSAQVWGRRWAG